MFKQKRVVFLFLFVGITIMATLKIGAICQDAVALADPRPSPVVGTTIHDGKLVLIVGKDKDRMTLPDGTYKNKTGLWISFKGGRPMALLVLKNTPMKVTSVKVYNGKVMFYNQRKKPIILPDGTYSLRNPKNGSIQVKNGMFVGLIAPVK